MVLFSRAGGAPTPETEGTDTRGTDTETGQVRVTPSAYRPYSSPNMPMDIYPELGLNVKGKRDLSSAAAFSGQRESRACPCRFVAEFVVTF